VPLAGQLELDPRSRRDAERLDVVAVEIQRDVAEAVDVEQCREDRTVADDGLGKVESDEALGIDRWAELLERNSGGQMRCGRRKQIASVERARDRLERVLGVRELVRLIDAMPARCG